MIYDELYKTVTYDIMKYMNEAMRNLKGFYDLWFGLVLVIFFVFEEKDENYLESGRICTTGDLSLIVTFL